MFSSEDHTLKEALGILQHSVCKQLTCTSVLKLFNKTIQFCLHTCFTSLKALSKLSLIAKLLFSISPRKFRRDRKLLSTKKVDKALRASTISWWITTDFVRISPFFSTWGIRLGIIIPLPCHCRAWFPRSCLIFSIVGCLVEIRCFPPSWKFLRGHASALTALRLPLFDCLFVIY